MTGFQCALALFVVAVIAGCSATKDRPAVRPEPFDSTPHTGTDRVAIKTVSRLSGLQLEVSPLPDGPEALDAWLEVISGAKRSIKIKTFIFRSDPVGLMVQDALLAAGDRGVEVRILLDDFFHRWEKGDLSRLAAHPNVTLRLFNPHSKALPAPMGFLAEFPRVNRRMHGKMMLVDDRLAIVGGRNIADEYFLRDPEAYFTDFDIRVEGADVRKFDVVFETFWEDELSVPYAGFRRKDEVGRLWLTEQSKPFAAETVRNTASHRNLPSFKVRGMLHADPPGRIHSAQSGKAGEVEGAFLSAFSAARSEVLVVTPYFIPEAHGARLLQRLAARGVAVTILTNSHASTNHPSVHAGYMRYRRALLKAGVRIIEFRGDAVRRYEEGDTIHYPAVVMHTKLAVIDRKVSLIGSPNFDPRSLQQNAELLMHIESPALAAWIADRYSRVAERYGYVLKIDPDGTEKWDYRDRTGISRQRSEPLGSLMDSAVTTFFRLFYFDQYL
ncbi:phospholipase D-like domain-containing protein [Ovoidimarina sediminis]|uniref:phospholipase D-like domain-containing protein n=1 Tax=Ovoidimarina sediminis TaxID=3079856 RepID=UPI002913745C|nr:phospholipase D family protein [Rhodophyticola sp. MJ-SS7]MDU8946456.1 phospholipase D family protein [Rhodophyticola sp. MJ-SS7]